MTVSQPSSVKSLILLMLFSVSCAVGIAVFSVQKFGPSGAYEVKNALITPYLLENMSYDGVDAKSGGTTRFVFDKLLFLYTDSVSRKVQSIPFSFQQYRQFYDTIISDSSLTENTASLASLFDSTSPSLKVMVKTVNDDPALSESVVFQEIQFASDGNFYRIELREEMNPQSQWAYYNHPGITAKITKLASGQQ